jgi:hypothetical protein
MTEHEFWNEARKRRNLFFLCFIGWIPFAAIYCALMEVVFGKESSIPIVSAFVIWAASWMFVESRIRKLSCPKCNAQAFKHCLFFMKDAKCQHCGYSFN